MSPIQQQSNIYPTSVSNIADQIGAPLYHLLLLMQTTKDPKVSSQLFINSKKDLTIYHSKLQLHKMHLKTPHSWNSQREKNIMCMSVHIHFKTTKHNYRTYDYLKIQREKHRNLLFPYRWKLLCLLVVAS